MNAIYRIPLVNRLKKSTPALLLVLSGSSTASAQLLPWDNWFYKLDHKHHEVMNLHNEAQELYKTYVGEHTDLMLAIKSYHRLSYTNVALAHMAEFLKQDPTDIYKLKHEIDKLSSQPIGSRSLRIAGDLAATIGGIGVASAPGYWGPIVFRFARASIRQVLGEGPIVEAIDTTLANTANNMVSMATPEAAQAARQLARDIPEVMESTLSKSIELGIVNGPGPAMDHLRTELTDHISVSLAETGVPEAVSEEITGQIVDQIATSSEPVVELFTAQGLTDEASVASVAENLSNALETSIEDVASIASNEAVSAGEEVAIEGLAESAATTSIGSTTAFGLGAFAFIGIDAIFGAINGKSEAEDLDHLIEKLRTKVDDLKKKVEVLRSSSATIRLLKSEQKAIFIDAIKLLENRTGQQCLVRSSQAERNSKSCQAMAAAFKLDSVQFELVRKTALTVFGKLFNFKANLLDNDWVISLNESMSQQERGWIIEDFILGYGRSIDYDISAKDLTKIWNFISSNPDRDRVFKHSLPQLPEHSITLVQGECADAALADVEQSYLTNSIQKLEVCYLLNQSNSKALLANRRVILWNGNDCSIERLGRTEARPQSSVCHQWTH